MNHNTPMGVVDEGEQYKLHILEEHDKDFDFILPLESACELSEFSFCWVCCQEALELSETAYAIMENHFRSDNRLKSTWVRHVSAAEEVPKPVGELMMKSEVEYDDDEFEIVDIAWTDEAKYHPNPISNPSETQELDD